MKKIKLFNDNVLVKVEVMTSSIVLPDTKKATEIMKTKNITILGIGEKVEGVVKS